MIDVVTLGEPLLRLSPSGFERLESAQVCSLHIGGAEVNTAVGLARLGANVAHIAKMPDNPLGRLVINGMRQHGVDTRCTVWTSTHRLGMYWLEEGNSPRPAEVLYDRADSAMCDIGMDDIEMVLRETLRSWWHTTGITLAISAKARATALSALQRVREAGGKISFDLNYRAKLWSYAEAQRECHPAMQMADLLFLPLRDVKPFFNLPADPDTASAIELVRERYPQAVVVITLGSEGAVAASPAHAPIYRGAVPVDTPVGRVGRGDAFVAGFLYAVLKGFPLADALNWGVCTAAIKYTIPGDLPILDRTQIERLLLGTNSTLLR